MRMFVMCGHCASGKSTFARQFAAANHYRYLSIDTSYEVFNGAPTRENKTEVWLFFFAQILAAERAGHDVVIDTNAPTKTDRDDFLNWFPDFEHHLIWIDATPATCLQNNANRSRVIPADKMMSLFDFFDNPDEMDFAAYKQRSHWESIIRIKNENNHLQSPELLFGKTPEMTINFCI